MLQFIGIGSALNPKLGNNGAFIKSEDGKSLFMIDCGELTYGRLITFGVLDGVEKVYVLMTHFHPDHVGSLGSLIFEMYYREPFESKVTVILPKFLDINAVLIKVGVSPLIYQVQRIKESFSNTLKFEGFESMQINPIEVDHDINSRLLYSYGYFIQYKTLKIYYSGDSILIPNAIQGMLRDNELDFLYQDVSTHDYPGNVHMSLDQLRHVVSPRYRKYVWCMHLDKAFNREEVEAMGFNVVKVFNEV